MGDIRLVRYYDIDLGFDWPGLLGLSGLVWSGLPVTNIRRARSWYKEGGGLGIEMGWGGGFVQSICCC